MRHNSTEAIYLARELNFREVPSTRTRKTGHHLKSAGLQQKLIEQYLNTFFRETNVDVRQMILPQNQNRSSIRFSGSTPNLPFECYFHASDCHLMGTIEHLSLSGFHRYGAEFSLLHFGQSIPTPFEEVDVLLELISNEIAGREGKSLEADRLRANLLSNMQNSVEKTHFFAKESQRNHNDKVVVDSLIGAEQGMLLGHPFHVTSKASSGFSDRDMRLYSPELDTSFKLHYFAASPELLRTWSAGGKTQKLIASGVIQEAKKALKGEHASYELIPCHPWQAKFLLEQKEVIATLKSGALVHLGELGERVWPTSSVRTVWLPQSKLFLKLSLDIRITNFIRNNPVEHISRALDASILLGQIKEQTPNLMLLPEIAGQTIEIDGFEASFGVVYRQGLTEEQQSETRILGSLVEEQQPSGRLPISHYIEQAANAAQKPLTSAFISDWWQGYIEAALIPTLSLFAEHGVSLEAHLQNSLMRFKDGMPIQLIVRDMEGTSVSHDSYLRNCCRDVSQDSPVWYSEDEAWFRFRYYVVVNHIAHLIATIARKMPVTETQLWTTTRTALCDKSFSPKTQHYAAKLISARTLPAKANLLSTYRGRGEKPVWVEIANPLFCHHKENLAPLSETSSQTINAQAETRVICQLLEALLFEGALPYERENNTIRLQISAFLCYQARIAPETSYSRIRLEQSSLKRSDGKASGILELSQVLLDIEKLIDAKPDLWRTFKSEIQETLQKHKQTLELRPDTPIRSLPYVEQEARINNGHLYHPSFKTRTGFGELDNKKYGPELSTGYSVIWLALDRSITYQQISKHFELSDIYKQHFSVEEHITIRQQLSALDLKADDYLFMPVHPWQWQHVISSNYQDQIAEQKIIKLDIEGATYLPQQSVRTLSDIGDINGPSLKLALSMSNTSTSRVLAPHTVKNAAFISDWLQELVENDQSVDEEQKPILLREFAGIGINVPDKTPPQYGALACIWRESVCKFLTEDQAATPIVALTQIDIDEKPVIADWIERLGLQTWLQELIERAYLPVFHLLWRHGVALEAHAQNMVLIHQDGQPIRVALKDFHDGVRFKKDLLHDPRVLPDLIDAPDAHTKVNPNSFLEASNAAELRDFMFDAAGFVNLAELAWFLRKHFGFSERKFWTKVKDVILRYQSERPEMQERFELFNIFESEVEVEQLASRRFMPEIRLRVMTVPNPLVHLGE